MNYRTDDRVEESSLIPSDLKEFMHRIEISSAHDWCSSNTSDGNARALPGIIDAVCGYCNQPSSLVCSGFQIHGQTQSVVMKGRCQRCQEVSTVLMSGAISWGAYGQGQRSKEFWVMPKPELKESKFIGFEASIPGRILKAYNAAIKLFNYGIWGSCITECGRALEGITSDKFPESIRKDKKNKELALGPKLDRLEAKLEGLEGIDGIDELFSPIIKLGNSMRLGRNTSAHFDVAKDPEKDDAIIVLDLAEYVISYFYVIPEKAEMLEKAIKALSPADEIGEAPEGKDKE